MNKQILDLGLRKMSIIEELLELPVDGLLKRLETSQSCLSSNEVESQLKL